MPDEYQQTIWKIIYNNCRLPFQSILNIKNNRGPEQDFALWKDLSAKTAVDVDAYSPLLISMQAAALITV